MDDGEDDLLLVKHRLLKQQKKTEMVAESADTATIKKLHVSSANLQRVSPAVCSDALGSSGIELASGLPSLNLGTLSPLLFTACRSLPLPLDWRLFALQS